MLHADSITKENGNGKRKRSLGCARDDETGKGISHISFQPIAEANLRPFGAPPSRGRRENAGSQTSHEEGLRYENTASPHSSFRAKARNLFRSRSSKSCEGSGERETPSSIRLGRKEGECRIPYRKSFSRIVIPKSPSVLWYNMTRRMTRS